MLQHLPEETRRLIGNAILALLGLAVLAAIWGTVIRVRESMESEREEIRKAGQLIAEDLDHELDVHLSHLRAMQYLAERFLTGRTRGMEKSPITHLVALPDGSGYQSVLPPEFGDLANLGRITGLGPVPAVNDPIAEEMTMAVGLTPIMRAIRERSPAVPWVQYASAQSFMFIFPYQGSEQFFFTPELLKREYFARATPQANPQRQAFWSQPYEDAAGQGTIVTLTQPIYKNDTFLGSVSIDFKVSQLQRYLTNVTIPETHVHVVTQDRRTRLAQAWAHPDDAHDSTENRFSLPLKNAPWAVELHTKNEHLLAAALRGRMWHMAAAAVLVVIFVLLLLQVRNGRAIRALAITDGLTGLYNRRHFDTVAKQLFEQAKRHQLSLGLALLDIDFFKKYNDHYGHQQGDAALKAVAGAIRQSLRRGSDQVFRVGGEEFAILLTVQKPEDLEPLMTKINQAVRDLKLPHAGNPCGYATISIGALLISQQDRISLDAAYKQADDALYQAKSTGRDKTVVQRA